MPEAPKPGRQSPGHTEAEASERNSKLRPRPRGGGCKLASPTSFEDQTASTLSVPTAQTGQAAGPSPGRETSPLQIAPEPHVFSVLPRPKLSKINNKSNETGEERGGMGGALEGSSLACSRREGRNKDEAEPCHETEDGLEEDAGYEARASVCEEQMGTAWGPQAPPFPLIFS